MHFCDPVIRLKTGGKGGQAEIFQSGSKNRTLQVLSKRIRNGAASSG